LVEGVGVAKVKRPVYRLTQAGLMRLCEQVDQQHKADITVLESLPYFRGTIECGGQIEQMSGAFYDSIF